jgi:hypothetical protein
MRSALSRVNPSKGGYCMSAPEGPSRLVTKLGHLRAAEQPPHPAGHARLWERNGSGEAPSGAGRRGDLQPDNLCDQRRCRLAAQSSASALSSGRRGRRFKSGHPDPRQRPFPHNEGRASFRPCVIGASRRRAQDSISDHKVVQVRRQPAPTGATRGLQAGTTAGNRPRRAQPPPVS